MILSIIQIVISIVTLGALIALYREIKNGRNQK